MYRKLLIIELNEFNTDLLRRGSNELGLSNIQRMLNMKYSQTFTENLEHGELDPWVQWVSVHLGLPHRIHKVTRLGELPNSKYLQENTITLPCYEGLDLNYVIDSINGFFKV